MTTNLPAKTTTSPALGLQLAGLLNENGSLETTAKGVVAGGHTEELRAAVPRLYQDAARQAGTEGVKAALAPWFATYPQPERSDQEWEAFWLGYTTICGHHSEAGLHGAMKTWAARSESEFLPKPGSLSELAKQTATPAFKLAGRAHNVLQLADDMVFRQRIEDDIASRGTTKEAQALAIRNMLADFNKTSEPIRKHQRRILEEGVRNVAHQRAPLPYNGGEPVPGGALTAQMYEVMGWKPPPAPAPESEPQFSEDA